MSRAQEVAKRHPPLLHRLLEARRKTDDLFNIVKPDSLYDRPIAERHRIVFYIGHLEAFDWNLLRERHLNGKSFNSEFDKLFSFGIDPVDDGLPIDQPGNWPPIEDVRGYVNSARSSIDEGLAALNSSDWQAKADSDDSIETLMNVAVEHRLMHAETLAYMFHQLPYRQKTEIALCPSLVTAPMESRMIDIPAGHAALGVSRDEDSGFGWDNEYEAYTTHVPAFAIKNHKVTNRQFLEFVEAGGYDDPGCWAAHDWEWKRANGIQHPIFWERSADGLHYRTMFHEIPLPMDWPVYVSHAEASAYARWAAKSLPTEAQWHRAAYGAPQGTKENADRAYPWGNEPPNPRRGNFDFTSWDPAPVGAFPAGSSAFGVSDLLGNGWEWTSSPFEPFPGFKPFSFYPGYSADFFDGKHYVIKGGSARTAASLLRRSFRNWFQPHYQYVYAGFRCVSN